MYVVRMCTDHVHGTSIVYVLQSYLSALLAADVGGVEVLDGQTLLLHVEAPQPLTRLVPTSALRLQHTPAMKTPPRLHCYIPQVVTLSNSVSHSIKKLLSN